MGPDRLVDFARDDVHASFLRVLVLLLAADPLVHIVVFGRHTCNLSAGESSEGYYRWGPAQDGASLLGQCGTSVEEVKRWHERFAFAGQVRDPFGPFQKLVRQSNRKERAKLTGAALLAHDLYDAAEVLRRYLNRYHGVEVPDELAVARWGPQHRRGPDLRDIVRKLDLDPQERLVWFIEGDTEEAYVTTWAERLGIDLRAAEIEVRNVHGTGYFKSGDFRKHLEYCRREKIFAFVSVDEDAEGSEGTMSSNARPAEPDHVRQLRLYEDQGHMPMESKVWPTNFVTANFTVEEVAAVARKLATAAGVAVTITAEEIEEARQKRPDGRPRTKPQKIEDAVKGLLWSKAKLPSDKGTVWGQALAAWAVENPRLGEGQEIMMVLNDDTRPITQVILRLLQAKRSDYDATVKHYTKKKGGKETNSQTS